MLEKSKTQLREISPALYHLAQQFYYASRRLVETHLLGTRLQEWVWKNRTLSRAKEISPDPDHLHRELLVQKISSYEPIESVLEIGCHRGPNLYLLSQKFPSARLYGIDINAAAIQEGQNRFKEMGKSNITLAWGKVDRLDQFDDKSMDVVFTDAVLMYVAPDKIRGVIQEMFRIAQKLVLLNEWHKDMIPPPPGNGKCSFYHFGHWIHDYRHLLSSLREIPKCIKFEKPPKGTWYDSDWQEFGTMIEVRQ